jgi:hypothetical protein
LIDLIVTVLVPELPACTVREEGFAEMAKSGVAEPEVEQAPVADGLFMFL